MVNKFTKHLISSKLLLIIIIFAIISCCHFPAYHQPFKKLTCVDVRSIDVIASCFRFCSSHGARGCCVYGRVSPASCRPFMIKCFELIPMEYKTLSSMWDYPTPPGIAEVRMRASKLPHHVGDIGSEESKKCNQSRVFLFFALQQQNRKSELVILCYTTRTVHLRQSKYWANFNTVK